MTITLTPDQEKVIRHAIDAGVVQSVDQFIDAAIASLPSADRDSAARREAVRRMHDFGDRHHLSLGEPITRKLLHEGHRH